MSGLTLKESVFIGLCIEGFFCGFYSAIFAMYFRHKWEYRASRDERPTYIIFYAFCALYVLCLATVVLATTTFINGILAPDTTLYMISGAIVGCCDFIPQCILIYRCWMVWGRSFGMVIIPSMLALAFLGTWIVPIISPSRISPHLIVTTMWGNTTILATCLAISLTVNVLLTGLIVLKLFTVYFVAFGNPWYRYGAIGMQDAGGRKLRSVIFVLIESAMGLFSIQLARIVLTFVSSDSAIKVSQPIVGMHQMLNGMTPLIIQVRVSMGLSFHDQESLVEVTSDLAHGSPDTGLDNPMMETGSIKNFYCFDSIPETGSTSIVRLETQSRIDIERAFM